MAIKHLIAKLYRLPRRLRMTFYILWNKVKFWMNDIEYGRGLQVHNVVY